MARKMSHLLRLALVALAVLITFHQTTQAGPPLICHPFEIGDARSLPWDGPEWRSVKADYSIHRLVEDTLALLTPDTPVLVRMETLRRVTVYAVWARIDRKVGYAVSDAKVADELLARLRARAEAVKGQGAAEALALFDYGYLVESYKQAGDKGRQAAGPDGYALLVRAIGLRGHDPAMEFAAALATAHAQGGAHREHLRKAVAGAADGSLLARNLVRHFGQHGKGLTELRAQFGGAPAR